MHVEVEVSGNVGTITLNRPEARNALSGEVTRLLDEAIVDLDRREEVGAIILTGADPAFCAGFDLRSLSAELHSVAERQHRSTRAHLGLMPAHDTPIIGAINGAAVTGGLELAMSCDFPRLGSGSLCGHAHASRRRARWRDEYSASPADRHRPRPTDVVHR